MGTFTLEADIDQLTGGDSRRVTMVRIGTTPGPISSGDISYEHYTNLPVSNGEFTVTLPNDLPFGYEYVVLAPQLDMVWRLAPPFTDGATYQLTSYTPIESPGEAGIVVLVPAGATLTDNGDGTGTLST